MIVKGSRFGLFTVKLLRRTGRPVAGVLLREPFAVIQTRSLPRGRQSKRFFA